MPAKDLERRRATHRKYHKKIKERWSFVHVTVDKEEYEQVRRNARRAGETISDRVRAYITWGIEVEDGQVLRARRRQPAGDR